MHKAEKKSVKRIRKDDQALVISGNSRGKTGAVMKVDGDWIYIHGVNLRKKHVKATRTAKGGIIEIEGPIHRSNVKVTVDGEPVKLRVRVNEDKQRELYFKKGDESVAYRTLSSK